MSHPANDPGWRDELGERVLWLVNRRESTAELRLNPAELGSLEIRVRVEKEGASVSFVVHNATARETVEAALPRLRELLGDAGLALTHVDVAERQAGEHRQDGDDGGGPGSDRGRAAEGPGIQGRTSSGGVRREGLVDTYV